MARSTNSVAAKPALERFGRIVPVLFRIRNSRSAAAGLRLLEREAGAEPERGGMSANGRCPPLDLLRSFPGERLLRGLNKSGRKTAHPVRPAYEPLRLI